jgi:hypothetical protein
MAKDDDAGKAPKRTDAELAIDRRVEEETKRNAEIRAQQEEMERERQESNFKTDENSLAVRALDASLGGVEHFACGAKYVGKAPQAEKGDSLCPTCQQTLTGGNSKFTPLPFIIPEAGLLVKGDDGKFFALPNDGTIGANATPQLWLSLLNPNTSKSIVPEASKAGSKERRIAAGLDRAA